MTREKSKTAVKSVTCGPKVLKPVTEAVLEKKNHGKCKTVKSSFGSYSDKNTFISNLIHVGGIKKQGKCGYIFQ